MPECFCGCGRDVGFRLRRPNRQGRAAARTQARLIEQALPLLDEHRSDHRMLRFVAETRRMAVDGPPFIDHFRAIVHEEEPSRVVRGAGDWQRAARERCDTIIVTARLVAEERERGL